ncbi:hypothetical protein A2954_06110 [Candidatus Roizmanbacteria bacterium RIFCSPLOWO2_01_FULL_37_12]|uniref:SD-repeat containing protein B domain-containing protein n=1 Tax=Candidatus Roizmanbacteria bacterium RIFCSPLOWO2_01_FULL_37_12 TaxID=1802056 RepID=A0A1F7ICJ3_9BACT|nr:MAG: hypothetical protein A2954_06110 [Candidatus Roizmanbacteria bacterium RIFCSPLOWO2_01_FULL_37_12]
MTKKLLAIFFAFYLLFSFIKNASVVQAQANQASSAQSAQLWRCLQATSPTVQRDKPPPPMADITVSGKGFISFQDIFIVMCVPPFKGATTGYKCSTGNANSDRLIFGSDLTGTISPSSIQLPPGTEPPNPVQASGDTIYAVLRMFNPKGHLTYAFFGVTISEPKVIPGQGSTIQYGTFEFQQDPQVQGGCKSIRWDPFGRVFDSQSLEPISNVRVTLLNKDKLFADMPGLTNPEITEADGVYNFFVDIKGKDPETFYVVPLKSTHTFTASPNLNPNYNKAYYDIYKPDEPIIEAPGVPEHRDIPLDPGLNPPFRSNPVSMTAAAVRLGRYTRYEGTVSHPLSIITLIGKNSLTEVARTNADREGYWTILVPNDNVPQNESLKLQIIKVDITTLSHNSPSNSFGQKFRQIFSTLFQRVLAKTSKVVSAQPLTSNEDLEFQPILSYIEGFAKDKDGNIIPNATVNVKLEMSDGVYFQTTADENGFFIIAPERLPIFNYYLEFVPPNSAVGIKTSTVDFATDNEEHLTANNTNLMAATKNGESLIPTAPPSEPPPAEVTNADNSKPSFFAGNNFNLILTVVALVVLLGVAGGVLMYIRKKKSETDDLL